MIKILVRMSKKVRYLPQTPVKKKVSADQCHRLWNPGTSNWGTHGESHVVDGSPADLVVHTANSAQARISGLLGGGEIEGRIRGWLGSVSEARNQRGRRTADGVFPETSGS